MSRSSDNLFREVFLQLHEAVSRDGNVVANGGGAVAEDESNSVGRLREYIVDDQRTRISERLVNLRNMRSLMRRQYKREASQNTTVLSALDSIFQTSSKRITLQGQAAHRQLKEQKYNSERRMRELLYEIAGEYGKGVARLERRGAYLWHANRVRLNWLVWQQRWQRFVTQLSQDISMAHAAAGSRGGRLEGKVLCGRADRAEIEGILGSLEKLGLHDGGRRCDSAVVRLVNASRRDVKDAGTAESSEFVKPVVVERRSEFGAMVHELVRWTVRDAKGRHAMLPPGSAGVREIPRPPPMKGRWGLRGGASAKLCQLLSSSELRWMQPASARPEIWDAVTDQALAMLEAEDGGSADGPDSGAVSSSGVDQKKLDEFTLRYASQHTSFQASDRLYFCLEERCAALQSYPFPAVRGEARDESSLSLMDALGALYCPDIQSKRKGGAFMTSTGSEKDDREDGSAEALELELSRGPVTWVGAVARHREAGRSAQLIDFPEVVWGRLQSGRLCHFVPAMMMNLVETRTFCGLPYSPEDLHDVLVQCPHPHLSYLASSKHPLLAHLYCLASCMPIPGVHNVPVLVPLSRVCMNELLRATLWRDDGGSPPPSMSPPSAIPGGGDAVPLPPPGVNISVRGGLTTTPVVERAAYLLPDHSRETITSGPQSDLTMLRHKYVLIRSRYSQKGSGKANSDAHRNVRGSESDSNRSKKGVPPRRRAGVDTDAPGVGEPSSKVVCYYLVQVQPRAAALSASVGGRCGDDQVAKRHDEDEAIFASVLAMHHQGRAVEEPEEAPKKWDTAVLSNVCRWRACLCDATPEPLPKYLCAYHTVVKSYLDDRSGKASESAKYLPRKQPPIVSYLEPDRDLVLVRAASTLLQELWDGKMKGTLRSFSNKVCEELNQRRRLGMIVAREREREKTLARARGGSPGPYAALPFARMDLSSPRWAKWKDKELLTRFSNEVEAFQTVMAETLRVEKTIASHLTALKELGVYPTSELATIRKEAKALREQLDVNEGEVGYTAAGTLDELVGMTRMQQQELRVVERKADLLDRRRQEEVDAQALALRKMARVRAMEEAQAKDPSNFGYRAGSGR